MTNIKTTWIVFSFAGLCFIALIFMTAAVVVLAAPKFQLGPTPFFSPTAIPNTPTAEPGSIAGFVWDDLCAFSGQDDSQIDTEPSGCVKLVDNPLYLANGVFDAGEAGMAGVTVRLGLGLCPSYGLMTFVTDDAGAFRFSSLPPGTYCVSIDPGESRNAAILLQGNWTYPLSSNSVMATTVTVGPGETRAGMSFGWDPLFLPAPPQGVPGQTASPPTPTPPACVNRASFIADIAIPDNTNVQTGQAFEKVWRVRNDGTCTWTSAYNLVFADGNTMSASSTIPLPGDVAPGQTVDLKVKMTAPAANGNYRGSWMISSPSGELFGIGEKGDKPIWVQIVVGPVSGGGPLSWRGEYFDNRNLKGTPVLVRYDASIDFNWKKNAPASKLPEDNFSVRWTTKAEFEAATYRFKVSMNDGARLYVDDKLVIESWNDGEFRENKVEVALARGTHTLRLEYYDHRGNARVLLKWEKVSSPTFSNWKGEYWNNRELKGAPALIRDDKNVAFDWRKKSPAVGILEDGFSARWTRSLTFEGGNYRFKARADDGVRIYVDGKLILNEWHPGEATQVYSEKVKLSAGKHKVVVEYYERAGKAYIEVWWELITPTPTPTVPPPTETPASPEATPTPESEITLILEESYCVADWFSGEGFLPCPWLEKPNARALLEHGDQRWAPIVI